MIQERGKSVELEGRLIECIMRKLRFLAEKDTKPFDDDVFFSLAFMSLENLKKIAKELRL